MNPFQPGFPPPGYGPPPAAPGYGAPQGALGAFTPPGAPAAPGPAQFGPGAPAGVPGAFTPPAAPGYGAPQGAPQGPAGFTPPQPPGGFGAYAGPQGAAPGMAAPGVNWAAAGSASVTPKSNPIPLGMHELEWKSCELAHTSSGLYFFAHYRITNSQDPRLVGYECTFMQNMHPKCKGGDNVALGAIKGMVLPFLGYRSESKDLDAHIGGILQELTERGTVSGQPFAGRKANATVTPGKRTASTPPDKDPFPKMVFSPVGQPA